MQQHRRAATQPQPQSRSHTQTMCTRRSRRCKCLAAAAAPAASFEWPRRESVVPITHECLRSRGRDDEGVATAETVVRRERDATVGDVDLRRVWGGTGSKWRRLRAKEPHRSLRMPWATPLASAAVAVARRRFVSAPSRRRYHQRPRRPAARSAHRPHLPLHLPALLLVVRQQRVRAQAEPAPLPVLHAVALLAQVALDGGRLRHLHGGGEASSALRCRLRSCYVCSGATRAATAAAGTPGGAVATTAHGATVRDAGTAVHVARAPPRMEWRVRRRGRRDSTTAVHDSCGCGAIAAWVHRCCPLPRWQCCRKTPLPFVVTRRSSISGASDVRCRTRRARRGRPRAQRAA